MGAAEETGKVASGVVEGLKSQPLALALIVINVLFLGMGAWVLHEVSAANRQDKQTRDALLQQMAANCAVIKPQGEK